MLNVKKLIASAESCLGWLYVSPGSNNQNGIDCSGLFVMDNTFDEDRYHYHVNRFNIGIVRRFAYNIVRLIQTRECPKQSMRGTANLFCDMWEYVEKYCFDGIERAS